MTDDEIDEALGICCGATDKMVDHIHKTLKLLACRSDDNDKDGGKGGGWERGTEALVRHLGDLYAPIGTLYLHYLDRLGLIEHGSGIAGSWLTAEGRDVLNELEARRPIVERLADTAGKRESSITAVLPPVELDGDMK